MTDVDVIVPCYRYGHYLPGCVDSILTQRDVQVRVLIIDDASPDDSGEVAERLAHQDSRVQVVRHVANRGHIATYNEGLSWCTSRYLLLLSADDYLLPGALAHASRLMDANPQVGFTFGNAVCLEQSGAMRPLPPPFEQPISGDAILTGREFVALSGARNVVPTPTAVVRTELQHRVGGYKTELPHTGDMEMWWRLASRGSVGYLDREQAVYRRHAGNMSLGYAHLRDVLERKSAIDHLFTHEGSSLFAAEPRLRERILHSLAADALGLAETAFAKRDFDTVRRLEQVALELSPQTRLSWKRARLQLKQLAGWKLTVALTQARRRA